MIEGEEPDAEKPPQEVGENRPKQRLLTREQILAAIKDRPSRPPPPLPPDDPGRLAIARHVAAVNRMTRAIQLAQASVIPSWLRSWRPFAPGWLLRWRDAVRLAGTAPPKRSQPFVAGDQIRLVEAGQAMARSPRPGRRNNTTSHGVK
jgi:hypothetical protein